MLVVVAHGEEPECLLAALSGTLSPRATVQAELMPWGSLLLADAPYARSEAWLVAGRPQRDPWGLPLCDLPPADSAAEFDRYGRRASLLCSGPLVAVELATGRLLRMPNGIVPVYEGNGAGGSVVGTSESAVRRLAGDVTEIPPGEAGPGSEVEPIADLAESERLPWLRWEWLDDEINARAARLGRLVPIKLAPGSHQPIGAGRWLSRTSTGDIVFLPPLRRAAGRVAASSPAVAASLWTRARLERRWLFAPALERPVRDTIALMSGPRSAK